MGALFKDGLKAYNEGRYEDAEELLRQDVENDDQNDEAWNILGLSLYELGHIDDATICLENALTLKPNNSDYKHNLRLIKRNGRGFAISSKVKTFLVILLLGSICIFAIYWMFMSPTSEKYREMGNELTTEGKYLEAIIAFDKAIEIDQDNSDLWNSKGVTLYKMSNYADAVVAYDKSIKLNLSNYVAWHNKGVLLYEMGRIEEAISAYDQALKINPNYKKSIDGKKIALVKIAPVQIPKPLPSPITKPKPSPTPTYDLSQEYHMTGRYVDSKSDAMREAEESQKWKEQVEQQNLKKEQYVPQVSETTQNRKILNEKANQCFNYANICENSCGNSVSCLVQCSFQYERCIDSAYAELGLKRGTLHGRVTYTTGSS